MTVHETNGVDLGSGRGDPRESAFWLLELYLATHQEADLDPAFIWSRSDVVDVLLCRWAFDKAEVSDELAQALREASLAPTAKWVGAGWAAEAARQLHTVSGLQGRLNAYIHALRAAKGIDPSVDPEGDTLTLDNDIPVYVCVPIGVQCKRPRLSSVRRLQGVVRSWERTERGTTTRLLSLGPLLSNQDATDDAGSPRELIDPPPHQNPAVEAGAAASPASTTGDDDGAAGEVNPAVGDTTGVFEHRLDEELGRSRREGGAVSVVLIQILHHEDRRTAEMVGELIAGCLRVYDVVSSQSTDQLLLLLPGADRQACASVVARIRQQLSARRASATQLCLGTASFPEEAGTSQELLACAARARDRDHQRLVCGEIEMGSVPACMVEQLAGRQDSPTTIWLGGVPIRMPVRVLQSEQGVRLKLPLSFLRKGVSFRLDLAHGQHVSGVLRDAVLSRYKSTDEAPVVYLEIERRGSF